MFNRKLKDALDHSTADVVLREYAQSKRVKIRAAVAQNRNCQPHVMVDLASDPEVSVRKQLACNPKLVQDAYYVLLNDPNEEIVRALTEAHPEPPQKRDRRA